jgi:hypothetical protein
LTAIRALRSLQSHKTLQAVVLELEQEIQQVVILEEKNLLEVFDDVFQTLRRFLQHKNQPEDAILSSHNSHQVLIFWKTTPV